MRWREYAAVTLAVVGIAVSLVAVTVRRLADLLDV